MGFDDDHPHYNEDPRYELMATVLEQSNAFGGDAEPFKEDFMEILKLCYTFTIRDIYSARDLAEQIVSYLSGQWQRENFEPYATEFWGGTKPATESEPDPTDTLT